MNKQISTWQTLCMNGDNLLITCFLVNLLLQIISENACSAPALLASNEPHPLTVHENCLGDVISIVTGHYLVSLDQQGSSVQRLSSEHTTECAYE